MDCSTPGLPVHHQLLEFTQTLVCWVGDAIQPSHPVVPFSSCLQSFTASGSFQMSQFFATGGQSIGVLASASTLPMNIQDLKIDWFYLLAVQGTLKSLLQHHSLKHQFLSTQLSLWTNSHIHRRRQWQPTPVLLPGKSHGRRSLVGCSPWGR